MDDIVMTRENIERVEWTLQDPEWQPSRAYLEKLLASYKEAAREIMRLRQDTNVLHADICAENDNLRAENERLRAALKEITELRGAANEFLGDAQEIAKQALTGRDNPT